MSGWALLKLKSKAKAMYVGIGVFDAKVKSWSFSVYACNAWLGFPVAPNQ